MKNNNIRCNLESLLKILDARAYIAVYVKDCEENNVAAYDRVKEDRVYTFLADPAFLKKYENYIVVGIVSTLTGANILIEEA